MSEKRKAGDIFSPKNLYDFELDARGAGSEKGTNRLSRYDLKNLRKQGGYSREALIDYADNFVTRGFDDNDKGYGGKAASLLDRWKAQLKSEPKSKTEAPVTEDPANSAPVSTNPSMPEQSVSNGSGGSGGNMSPNQNVNQDNDITTTIDGNNNEITNAQDNSITQNNIDNSDNRRFYGGGSRTFNYRGGDGESRLYDSPVSMATMGGYYDVDDSPSANAKFVDMYTDLNNQNQRASDKYYKANGTFNYSSDESRAFDPVSMMNRIDEAPQRSYDRADREAGLLFGDMWKWKNTLPRWQMPTPGAPIESNVEEIAEEYTDKIK